jgi:hypothetical protein
MASLILAHMNVLGDASVVMNASSEPGKESPWDSGCGTKETRASLNWLDAGSKQSGAPRRMRPRMLSGAEALKIAASVPPREWPARNGFVQAFCREILATHSEMACVYSSSPLPWLTPEAGIHSRR